mmetsp:Transcript_31748/g.82955  ORF Transcript_31748/g.82955 Transcript_31748/m.82955 type:complete len:288 (+) Transcript_31748:837-1700(+)
MHLCARESQKTYSPKGCWTTGLQGLAECIRLGKKCGRSGLQPVGRPRWEDDAPEETWATRLWEDDALEETWAARLKGVGRCAIRGESIMPGLATDEGWQGSKSLAAADLASAGSGAGAMMLESDASGAYAIVCMPSTPRINLKLAVRSDPLESSLSTAVTSAEHELWPATSSVAACRARLELRCDPRAPCGTRALSALWELFGARHEMSSDIGTRVPLATTRLTRPSPPTHLGGISAHGRSGGSVSRYTASHGPVQPAVLLITRTLPTCGGRISFQKPSLGRFWRVS